MKEDSVFNGVEGSCEIEKAETGDLLLTYCSNQMVV